jgi:dephospho-CoA kinase
MESGIMFESGINTLVDRVVAVIAPKDVRIQRVMERDRITKEKVLEWMDRQMPQRDVIKKADFVVINDGQMDLERQIIKIIDQCNK